MKIMIGKRVQRTYELDREEQRRLGGSVRH